MTPLCVIDGCDRRGNRRGLCNAHRMRVARHGSTDLARQPQPRFCTVKGCRNRPHGRGLCHAHHRRLRLRGDVFAHIPLAPCRPGGARRWPADALRPYVESGRALAWLLGVQPRTDDRWPRLLLTNGQADDAALALGLMACEVWPDWLEVAA